MIGLIILLVIFGKWDEKYIPNITGRPSRTRIFKNKSAEFNVIVSLEFDAPRYNPDQKLKLSGFINAANKVDTAVKLTDSATLALASEEKKFDIFPPGQADTSINPNPSPGSGSSISIIAKVMAGNNTN